MLAFLAVLIGVSVVSGLPSCFISMGDWGSVNEHVTALAQHLGDIASNPASYGCEDIKFIFALGDNFYPTGVTSIHDPQWQTTFVNQFRNQSSLATMPFYAVVGDHDYNQLNPKNKPNMTRALAQVEYHTVDPNWIIPDTNYTFRITFGTNTLLFVVLDTEAMYTCLRLPKAWCFKKDQDQWLDDVLTQADNDSSIAGVVIVGHHAVVCPLGGHYDPKIDDVIVPIARRHRVSVILTAHSHFLAYSRETKLGSYPGGELWYIINGAARGAGAYQCWWNGLHFQVARPTNKTCMPYEFNRAGGFMLHRVHSYGIEQCIGASLNGTLVQCFPTIYRTN